MKKKLLIIFCLLIAAINGVSQTVNNTAPVKWESYKISENKVKLMFPKFPVRIDTFSYCQEIAVKHFYAYADEVVYEVKIFEKSKEPVPISCSKKEKFTAKSFDKYFSDFQDESGFKNSEKIRRGENEFIRLEKSDQTHKFSTWILNDFKNLRWFEFTFSTYKEKKLDENFFVDSLEFEVDEKSIEINNGAEVLLGDEEEKQKVVETNSAEKSESKEEKVAPFVIITRPRPRYTSEARKGNVAGSVRIRVTFLPNGAIGSVTPVSEFDEGLTGQAINVTRKMAFLPKKNNDRKLAITKVVVYNFSIY